MKHVTQYAGLIGMMSLVALTGCPTNSGFQQPEGTVPVNFTIDASGRPGFYADGDLQWKGALEVADADQRTIQPDPNWDGPFPDLFDDGPWTSGGHEPKNAVAHDNKFGTTVFIAIPTTELTIEYGAQTKEGGWVWPGGGPGSGGNGQLIIPANAPEHTDITAAGFTMTPEGTNDIKLTLDTNQLSGTHTVTQPVEVKGTFADWALDPAYDDGTHGDAQAGDGIYTYTLSAQTSPKRLKLASGANVEFIWNFGRASTASTTCSPGSPGCGEEYKNSSGAEIGGVGAGVKGSGASTYTSVTPTVLGNGNTGFTVP